MLPASFWTAERIALLGTCTDAEIANRLGISHNAVFVQRKTHKIPPWNRYRWGETELELLRTSSDQEVAEMTGRSFQEIAARRRELI
jgi:hypothetical protein